MEQEKNVSSPNGDTLRDRAARTLGTVVGAIPIIGPFVQLAVSELIPNQRLDRIESFLRLLAEKFSEAELKAATTDPKRLDVLEEGITQATRSLSEERQRYIAELVVRGLKAELAEATRARHFMRILNQLDDAQIIILMSYLYESRDDKNKLTALRTRNPDVLQRRVSGPKTPSPEKQNYETRISMITHLAAFGLLKVRQQNVSGDIRYRISSQGEEFIRFLGIET